MKVPGNTNPVIVSAAAAANVTSIDVSLFAVNALGGGGTYQFNGKYPTLNYPSLGSAVIANYAMGSNTDIKNPTEYKFGAYSLWNQDYNVQSTTYTQGKSGGRYYTFQLISSLFSVVLRNTYPCQLSMV